MNLQTATETLADFLNEKVFDPISKRASCWIYTDKGRVNLDKTNYPKILFENEEPTTKQISHIGSLRAENTDIISIKIKAKFGHKYKFGEKEYTGKEFIGEIARQISEEIKNNQTELNNECFQAVYPTSERITYDQEANPTFDLRVKMIYTDK